jgi:hypothetical protein
MNADNPDTLLMQEQSEWAVTQMDDVFLPSVRVQLGWKDVEDAVARGAIVPAQAHGLWAIWAAPGSPLRRSLGTPDHASGSIHPEPIWPDAPLSPPATGVEDWMHWVFLLAAAGVGAGLMYLLLR